eukprot:SAG31_NODE_2576_length_5452_cov_2.351018_6_plen_57_part_00
MGVRASASCWWTTSIAWGCDRWVTSVEAELLHHQWIIAHIKCSTKWSTIAATQTKV